MIDSRRIKVTTQPTEEPISLEEAKEQLHITHDYEDIYIDSLIVASRIYCEQIARRAFVTRTYTAVLDCWPLPVFELPNPPLLTVTSIKYTDIDSVQTTFSSTNYMIDTYSEPGRIALKWVASWPTVSLREINGVEIIYTAGYGAPDDVPETYKAAIKLLVAHLYENREAITVAQGISVVTTPLGLDALLLADRGGW